jgi:hypothetical protein
MIPVAAYPKIHIIANEQYLAGKFPARQISLYKKVASR